MKNSFTTLMAFFATSVFCQGQNTSQQPVMHKDKGGDISAVEFYGAEKDAPTSANAFFEKYLKAKADQFQKVPHRSGKNGFLHEHYDQYYKGIKVDGAGYNVHFKDGKIYFANGHYVNVEGLGTKPSISLEKAMDIFLKYKNIDPETVVSTITDFLIKEVVVQADAETLTTVHLVHRIYVESDDPHNDEVGYVDAHTGKVVITEPRLTDLIGTFATRYSGSRQSNTDPVAGGHRLFDNSRGAIIHTRNLQNSTVIASAVELIDNDNNWTAAEHAANENDMGLDVHWGLQQIYDYLRNTHGINSFDNAAGTGFPINAYIRFGISNDDRDNAGWNPTTNLLVFGDGVSLFRPVASLDAVAHEFGHGITDFQIGWNGSFDQRAFNEGMSDIWGAILEQRIRPNSTWRIGEQLTLTKSHLRNMQNTNDGNSLMKTSDTFLSSQYNNADNPYIRGGVLAHWFYIIANGEAGTNDLGNTYSVAGIGLDRAEQLIVEAVFNNYLDGTTTYPAIRTAMINAALALFCNNSPEVRAVTNAWHAVGVGAAYTGSVISIAGGSSPICTSSSPFTVSNLPSGTSVLWGSGNPGGLTVNASGVATRKNGFNGQVNVLASVQSAASGCGPSLPVTLPVWVGSPSVQCIGATVGGYLITCLDPDNPVEIQQNLYYTFYAQPVVPNNGATYYWYTYPSSGSYSLYTTTSNPTSLSFSNAGYNTVVLASRNACGWGFDEPNAGIMVYSPYGIMSLSVSPNPATDYLDIQLSDLSPGKESLSDRKSQSLEVALICELSMETILETTIGHNGGRLDLSSIPAGGYVLQINDGKTVHRKHVFVK